MARVPKIEVLDISGRIKFHLVKAGIFTIPKLCAKTGRELERLPGITRAGVDLIRAELDKHDWQLADEMPQKRHWIAMPWAIINAPSS